MLCFYTASRGSNTDVDINDGVTQRYVRDRVVIYPCVDSVRKRDGF